MIKRLAALITTIVILYVMINAIVTARTHKPLTPYTAPMTNEPKSWKYPGPSQPREGDLLNSLPAPEHPARTTCALTWKFFILHRSNFMITQKTIQSLINDGIKGHIVLIDVSTTEETTQPEIMEFLRQADVQVLYPHLPLGLGPGMEYIRRRTLSWGLDFILYSHNDAVFEKSVIKDALASLCRTEIRTPNWGVLFFHYDVFCAYNVRAWRDVAWDSMILNYRADYDWYHRLQRAGFAIVRSDDPTVGQRVGHKGSSVIKNLEKLPPDEYYGWFISDFVARYIYYYAKWGTLEEPSNDPSSYQLPFNGQMPELKIPPGILWFSLVNLVPARYFYSILIALIAPYVVLLYLYLRSRYPQLHQRLMHFIMSRSLKRANNVLSPNSSSSSALSPSASANSLSMGGNSNSNVIEDKVYGNI